MLLLADFLTANIQNQFGIGQRIVVDKSVQLQPLVHTVCYVIPYRRTVSTSANLLSLTEFLVSYIINLAVMV